MMVMKNMNKTFILVDTANIFYKSRYGIKGPLEEKVGLCINAIFHGINKTWKMFKGTHIVFLFEGRSWRKDVYKPYKSNRTVGELTPTEEKEEQLFWETFESFKNYVYENTNCSTIQHPILEADDLISGWIDNHPNDKHVIISSDGDFAQLLSENVSIYNGITGVTTTIKGYFDDNGKSVIDSKTKKPKDPPNPEWLLFKKCIRGDTSDCVFSAYPNVREKSSKNKVGMLQVFEDRNLKGFNWNNFMLQTWVDHEGVTHTVGEDYLRNLMLCGLHHQPDNIKDVINQTIKDTISNPKNVSMVGVRFLKFCGKYELLKLAEQANNYVDILNAKYQ